MHGIASAEDRNAVSLPPRLFPLTLRIGFWICIVIAVAVVLRRLLALAFPPQNPPPQMAGLDAGFASHAALTIAHVVPALLFVLLLPLTWIPRLAATVWLHRLLFGLGALVGCTAYAMSFFPVGGWIEVSAVLFFNTLFLYSLARAWRAMRRCRLAEKQEWMTRAVAILLGIATTRPVMGVFFATSMLTHLRPQQFFGLAFWVGFSINAVAIEVWLRRRRRNADPAV